jgi:hypothetical protein
MYLHVVDGALMLAQVLAGIGTNGINLSNLGGAVGKREAEGRGAIIDSLVGHAAGLYSNQVKPAVENAVNGMLTHFSLLCSHL